MYTIVAASQKGGSGKTTLSGHLAVEADFPSATLAELHRRGHGLEIHPRWGHYNSMTMATREKGVLRAAASPRRMQCYAIGR